MTMLSRRAHRATEPLHTMIYFAPEAAESLAALGLNSGRLAYFAGRAAPMGAVGAGVVTATFYNFKPATVAEAIPRAWSITSPQAVVAARYPAAEAALRRLLGTEVIDSEVLAEAADLAREAAEGCAPEARPLYAAYADQDWPESAHGRLWHAVSLLREYRGDGHLWALQRAGLSGLQALVLQITSGEGLAEAFAKSSRGWSDEEWDRARDELRERGLLDAANGLTERATDLREQLEAETDALASAPWKHLGDERTERLITHGKQLASSLLKAGAFPAKVFARRS